VGDRFLVGDGAGRRAWAEVTEREGERGIVLREDVAKPLHELSRDAYDEAVELYGRERLSEELRTDSAA
jgi:hypothetical protein